ncbi:MAG: bifunctional ornithine acetyltransferase/N-acetylglutamate synthase [Rhodospirillaceae bacterium]|nr:bifunctional ornithine acetyltransferase/N-acetylglutamate synthase [Rhodospirillaceae bacterium]
MIDDTPQTSPLAPDAFPAMSSVDGVRMAAAQCNVRYVNKTDVMLAVMEPGTTAAGVFTQSKTAAAPVDWCRDMLKGGNYQDGTIKALIVNSGNANAFTGRAGIAAVEKMAAATAEAAGCRQEDVFIAQTGVIGEPIEVDKITASLPGLKADLGSNWENAAQAIMTTDTYPKGASATADIGGTKVTIAGIAKGSGMIAPDMATMLAFVFTDAALPREVLQNLLADSADKSFNAITVDSDTSTSDTVLAFATGRVENPEIAFYDDRALQDFRAKFDGVMTDLAHQIVRDGEGAKKFITIKITGAEDDGAAKKIGMTIANSPLVKTAIAGEDANWGRVVMAVGKSGEKADRDKLTIAMGGITIAELGQIADGYDEAPVAQHMKGQNIDIAVDVGISAGKATVWTCDLTHDYISINADYRT